jgi:hypothetical protein
MKTSFPLRPPQTLLPDWRLLLAGLLLILLFATIVTQLALPGLDVASKTMVSDPKCPTPEQRAIIEDNLRLYGAGFHQGYDTTAYGLRLVAMARTLGYPEPSLKQMPAVVRFLREALKKKC